MTERQTPDPHPSSDIEALLGDRPELLETAGQVHDALHDAEIDPAFRSRLREELVLEHHRASGVAHRPTQPSRRRQSGWLIGAVAAAVVIVAAAAALAALLRPGPGPRPVAVGVTTITAVGNSVAPSAAIVVHFDTPMDHAAVEAALRVSPATIVTTQWRGNDLVLTGLHGLVPNASYVVTVLGGRAKTSAGAPMRTDASVVFGTARAAALVSSPSAPATLTVRPVTFAADGSEAVITSDGSLIATAASAPSSVNGMVRIRSGSQTAIAPATNAICVSRSGRSLAYLAGDPGSQQIVFASSDGSGGHPHAAVVDEGSPLGWINDDEVSFVSGGRLSAIDRVGRVRTLTGGHIDAVKDTVVIAPGGRYAYVRSSAENAPGDGQLIDLVSGRSHPLAGIVGQPAFDAAGTTVAWIDGSTSAPRLASAASAGGPVMYAGLPVKTAPEISDLALSPDGARFVYSVTQPDNRNAEFRLASTPDGVTLAISRLSAGRSPNWSPTGDRVAVLGEAGGQPQIQTVDVPPALESNGDLAQGVAAAFANAQVGADADAQQFLLGRSVPAPVISPPSRAVLVQVTASSPAAEVVRLRLVTDATTQRPIAFAVDEELSLRIDAVARHAVIDAVHVSRPYDLPPGPHVSRIDPAPGAVKIELDSDLQPASVVGAVSVLRQDGTSVPVTASYDVDTRTITARLAPPVAAATLTVVINAKVRDVAGQGLSAPYRAQVDLPAS